ncbi:hypothetical protein SSP35_26_00010, partial [Streptomyces sp. NBRC 110611]|uniref:hypothetical protein n=1 Tax=Streptomyces sp. NBRC 110611 TaxID=1621259 RepID=UPI00085751DC
MSQWAQAFGVLGAVVMAAFGGANWRLPFLERYRILGLGFGLLVWVLARFDAPGFKAPQWYQSVGAAAMLLAGASGLAQAWQGRRRGDREAGDDGPSRAAGAAAYLRRYFQRGALEALDAAVEEYRAAVRATAGTGPQLLHQASLLKALRIRYERLLDRADLDEAVRLGRQARSLRGPRSHRALLLTELSTALRLRHDHTGASDDLAEARGCGEAALALLHPRQLLFPLCSSRLSAVWQSRYEHTGDPRHLDTALTRLRAALDSAAERGYARDADEIRLCYLLTRRGHGAARARDLSEAVAAGRRALARIAPTSPLYAPCLHHLSVALRTAHDASPPDPTSYRTYRIRSDHAQLEHAEDLARQALLRPAAEAPETARYHLNHALTLHALHRVQPDRGRLDQALEAARTAALHPTADVPTRVRAGLVHSDIATTENLPAQAVAALENVIELLPRLASHELERTDQEQQIARWPGIAVAAATSALEAGEPAKAAVLLEHGRGVLLSRTLALRTDLTALRAAHPELAEELAALRTQLAMAGTGPSAERLRRARRAQDERWHRLLRRIHDQPGFEDFALPPTADRLRAQGAQGPLIYLNVSAQRSDAIVVTADGIRAVP